MKALSTLVAAGLGLALASAASATIIFTPGNHPQPDEANILFESTGTTDGPATTITGSVDGSSPALFVSFTSTENLQPTASGQADVQAVDGQFQDLLISLPGGTFGDFILNPSIFGSGNSVSGNMVVTVDQVFGAPAVFNFDVSSAGNNFLTITTAGGERISSISLSTTASGLGITRLAQPRISSTVACPPGSTDPLCTGIPLPAPEPGILALVGLGLAGLFAARIKRS
jgi:hypothetical protein